MKTWGWAAPHNPIGVHRELVAFVNVQGHFGEVEKSAQADALPLVMEHGSDGWKVASLRKSYITDDELMAIDPRDR